jgi:membrane protein YdbS with pleckstrin-like domain
MTCSSCGAYVPPASVLFELRRSATATRSDENRSPAIARAGIRRRSGSRAHSLHRSAHDDLHQGRLCARGHRWHRFVFLLASLGVPASISIPLALALLLIPAYYHIRRNMVRYTVTDSKLQIDTGLIARTTKNIPLSKVQDVTVSASIPQRMMGFGDIIIDNASEIGGSIVHAQHQQSTPLRRPSFARIKTLALN